MRLRGFVLTTVVAVAMVAAASGSAGPSVTGGGTGTIPSGPFAGDRLHVSLTARHQSGARTQGRFTVVHRHANGGLVAEISGTVDCLSISGNDAKVTGVITHGHVTEAPSFDPAGHKVAIRIIDDGHADHAGFASDFGPAGQPVTTPCQSVAAGIAVDDGNFTVHR